jgi:hypothetical protein
MPIKRHHLGGATAALLYALWPATPAPAPPAPVGRSDHYFDFVRPTAPAAAPPTAAPPTAAPAPAGPADAAPNAALPARLHAQELAVRTLRRQGGDANAVYRLRAATLGAPLAARLAEMDDAEARWRSRLDAYQAERARLAAAGTRSATPAAVDVGADTGADAKAGGGAALARLRDEFFAPDELARLDASLPSGQPRLTPD